MELSNFISKNLNKPLIEEKVIFNHHKIFVKYTSKPYFIYAFELLETLCQKTPYKNKKSIFHTSLSYLIITLYKCGNIPYLSNFDMMIFCCFFLSIKTQENQKQIPSINKLKRIYEEKFSNYKKEEIIKGEIICLKLLDYNINIFTSYECLCFLLNNNSINDKYYFYKENNELEIVTKQLENKIINNINEYVNKSPLDIAREILSINNLKIKRKFPQLITRKIVPMVNHLKSKKEIIINNVVIVSSNRSSKLNNLFIYKKNKSPNEKNHDKTNTDFTNLVKSRSKVSPNISNIYRNPVSVVLSFTKFRNNCNNLEKMRANKSVTRNSIMNSSATFRNSSSNLETNLNSSINNCEIFSPYDRKKRKSYIKVKNITGKGFYKNSSLGNIFKKPCLDKNSVKTYFTSNKKQILNMNNSPYNTKNFDLNSSVEYIEQLPKKITLEKVSNDYFTSTFYFSKKNKYPGIERRLVKIH